MSRARKLAIPAAGLAAAAITPGAGTAAAATAPHHRDAATVTQATSRRARAIDILDQRPTGVHPDTTSNHRCNGDGCIYFYIAGSGPHVSFASTHARAGFDFPRAHIEIQKPNGAAYKNSGQENLPAGHSIGVSGFPDINYSGNWRAILWSQTTPGHYENLISVPIHVDS